MRIGSKDFRVREGDEVDLTQMIEDTPAQYKARIQQHAEKTLGAAVSAVQAAGVVCETVKLEHEHPY
jgi:hypothetical protein